MNPLEFSQEEFNLILQRSQKLIRKGYFTGVNFLQSENVLPRERIIIHFLHNSRRHIEDMLAKGSFSGEIVPRHSFYKTRPEYFQHGAMKMKYSEALFFNPRGKQISAEQALVSQEEIYTLNPELDLLIPFSQEEGLEDLVGKIQKADDTGILPWIDPVLILRSDFSLFLPHLHERTCVSLSKEKEEFYIVLPTIEKKKALVKYLKRLCHQRQLGNVRYTDIVFSSSFINKEFAEYLTR